ncbi:hypothetical protein ACJMK2_002547 [Sinanodonta woodiana]|uniref:Uncharacterized protein n=1 Tax=Sinanodonta woodiana TaxID=1069815 RepID=A0ABD3XVJ0_SINWO
MRNLTLLLLILVVCAVALSKNIRKRRSLSIDDVADIKRLLEEIDAGNVDLDENRGESPRMFVRWFPRIRWPFGKK